MNALQQTALVYVMAIAVICTVVIMVLGIMPGRGITFYPGLWMTTAALAPLFLTRLIANYLWRRRPELLSGRSLLTFGAMVLVPVAGIALLTEAAIVTTFLGPENGLTLSEVIFAPSGERYSVEVVFGMSFFMSLMVATILSVLFFVPTHITRISLSQ